MGFDCCSTTQNCLLFIFNFAIWAFSAACIAVGIWALVDANFVNTIESIVNTGVQGLSLSTIHAAAGLLIGIGAITFIIAFCGCCGAIKKSKCLLRIYIGAMVILMLLQIAAVVMALVLSGTIDQFAKDIFLVWVKVDVRANGKYTNEEQKYATEIVAFNQFSQKCCGVNGPADYKTSQYVNDTMGTCALPPTCCTQTSTATWDNPLPTNSTMCCMGDTSFIHNTGCSVNFYTLLPYPYWMLYVFGICLIVIQIAVTIFACSVHKAIDDDDRYV